MSRYSRRRIDHRSALMITVCRLITNSYGVHNLGSNSGGRIWSLPNTKHLIIVNPYWVTESA